MCSCRSAGRTAGSGAGPPGIPSGLGHQAKPQLAIAQLKRLLGAGLPVKWAAYDEVYGRSSELRRFCESRNLAYVAVVPCDFRVTLPSGAVIRADQAVKNAVFERRSCGNGSKGPPVRGLGAAGHRPPAALPAHPPPAVPPGRPDLLPVLGGGRHPGDDDISRRHRRTRVAGGRNVQDRERRPGLGPVPARAWDAVCQGTALWPPSPSSGGRLAATTCAATSPSRPPPAQAATTAVATTATSAALTWASRSATRPFPPAAGSPARPASPRSGSPSPKPPASNAWPGGARSQARRPRPPQLFTCAGPPGGAARQARARWHHYSTPAADHGSRLRGGSGRG